MRRFVFAVLASFLLYYCLCAALNFAAPEIKKAAPKNGCPF
jgi:hypothetical protein